MMPVRGEKSVCPHCGSTMARYPHKLNLAMVRSLAELSRYGSANIARIGLTHSQIANFNKLRYWGLADRVPGKRGFWRVTEHGREFLSGRAQVYSLVVTYRNKRERWDGKLVSVRDFAPEGFAQREDYAATRENIAPPPPQFKEGRLF